MRLIPSASGCLLLLLASAAPALAAQEDFSGRYDCTGHDQQVGDYKDQHELSLVPTYKDSTAQAYAVSGFNDGQLAYRGHAIVDGASIAVDFASIADPTDHGVLLGRITRNGASLVMEGKYFEPEFHGGGGGTAHCERLAD